MVRKRSLRTLRNPALVAFVGCAASLRTIHGKKSGAQAPLFHARKLLRDDARRDGREHVVVADLHPLVTVRGRVQVVAVPVVHHVLAIAVACRQAAAAVPMPGAMA